MDNIDTALVKNTASVEHPVLVVGAGPTGLSMAIELARFGIPVRIIEKKLQPITTSNALGVQPRTQEIFGQLGLLNANQTLPHRVTAAKFYGNPQLIATLDLTQVDSDFPGLFIQPQATTEHQLAAHLTQLGVKVERGLECVEIKTKTQSQIVSLKNSAGDVETIEASWLVACDGAHSFVRKSLCVGFPGIDLPEHFVMADVKIHGELDPHTMYGFLAKQGLLFIVFFEPGVARIIAEVSNDPLLRTECAPRRADFERLLAERCPLSVKVADDPSWATGFWVHSRHIEHYRLGRVFFAGDAAHVHSPAGGQGFNLGVQDAYNLGWKLALVIKQQAPETLLDSYEEERRPIAAAVLRSTTLTTRLGGLRNSFLQELRNVVLSFFTRRKKIMQRFVTLLAELDVNYAASTIVGVAHASPFPTIHLKAIPAGLRAPNATLDASNRLYAHPTKLHALFTGLHHHLLVFTGQNKRMTPAFIAELHALLTMHFEPVLRAYLIVPSAPDPSLIWSGSIILDPRYTLHERYGIKEPTLYIIRPDQYIGFQCDVLDIAVLHDYLTNIFL